MNLLSRYIARIFVKYWVICLLALLALVVVASVFGNLDNVFAGREALLAFLDETVRAIPVLLDLLIPMTVLLATMFTFNSLGQTSELVAMQSVGMGLVRQLRPICLVLVLVAALDYFNQNYLVRWADANPASVSATTERDQWHAIANRILYLRRVEGATGRIHDARVYTWSEGPYRLDALEHIRTAQRREDHNWRLTDIASRHRATGGWALANRDQAEREAEVFPSVEAGDAPDAHHVPFFELSARIRQLESQGARVELYVLEWYQKTAALFAPFALAWFGTPLSLTHFRRGRASGEIMVGILGGLVFLIATETLYTLGKGGFLPPIVATWAVNGVFMLLGCLLLRRVR